VCVCVCVCVCARARLCIVCGVFEVMATSGDIHLGGTDLVYVCVRARACV
jgi:hypothetical protein